MSLSATPTHEFYDSKLSIMIARSVFECTVHTRRAQSEEGSKFEDFFWVIMQQQLTVAAYSL